MPSNYPMLPTHLPIAQAFFASLVIHLLLLSAPFGRLEHTLARIHPVYVHLATKGIDALSDSSSSPTDPSPTTEASIDSESRTALPTKDISESTPDPTSRNMATRQPESQVRPAVAELPPSDASTPVRLTPIVYFRPEELSTPPRIRRGPELNPEIIAGEIKKRGGSVVVRVFIGANGGIDEVLILENTLSDKSKEHIVTGFQMSFFDPGLLGKKAVHSQMDYEINLETLSPTRSRSSDNLTR
jgi:hypothetical protein